jgi:group II intron reverse transcriptase/maturase
MGQLTFTGAKHQVLRDVVLCGEGNRASRKDVGSRSPFIVPIESRVTYPREPVSREGRDRFMEPFLRNMEVLSDRMNVSTKQERIAEVAKRAPKVCFTAINHFLDLELLMEAYKGLRKDSAAGVDGQIVAEYGKNLDVNLQSLLERARSGTYKAPPVKRVYIPKGGSGKEMRPIGIPTVEDKVLQRAVVMLLEPIYEQDFLNCSYAFRRDRSAHMALEKLWKECMDNSVTWVLDLDISKFFDTIDRAYLRSFLDERVRDGVIRKLIDKWMKAGVFEEGFVYHPESGTPQGGVISPLLSNIFLHYVLDEWFENEVKPRLKGTAFLVRFADDAVLGFESEEDAKKVLNVIFKRFNKFGLMLHPEKTRLLPFSCKEASQNAKVGTFDFLGFTHYWGKSRKGAWVVKKKTSRKRLTRSLKRISQWCRENRHAALSDQNRTLSAKLRGHFSYFGITGNSRSIQNFGDRVRYIWWKWLSRRKRGHWMSQEHFERILLKYPLPGAKVVHSIYAARP